MSLVLCHLLIFVTYAVQIASEFFFNFGFLQNYVAMHSRFGMSFYNCIQNISLRILW